MKKHSDSELIHGKYTVLYTRAETDSSIVYLTIDKNLNQTWILKQIPVDSEIKDLALKEIEMLKTLSHPMIPRITDIFDEDGYIYVVMDYINGDDTEVLRKKGVAFSEEEVVGMGRNMLDVLSYLHSRTPPIIHRDIKPSNIMHSADGHISLIDFGIARFQKENSSTDTQFLGTKGYAAPEQWAGAGLGQTDARTDIYGLGITMHSLLTGKDPDKPPYEILPLTKYDPSLSTGLSKVILKATKNDPEKRYQTDAEFLHALTHYHEFDKEALAAWKKRRRASVALLVAAAVFIVGGFASLISADNMKESDYASLLMQSSSVEALETAISLYPAKEEGYKALIDHYAEDFTPEASEGFTSAFEGNKSALSPESPEYSGLMFHIGKAYLTSYKSGNPRENILLAAPYLSEVRDGGAMEASGYYTQLAGFIRDYIIGGETGLLGTQEITASDIKGLTGTMSQLQKSIGAYEGADKPALMIVSNEIMFSVIDSLSSSLKDAGSTSLYIGVVETGREQLAGLALNTEALLAERDASVAYADGLIPKLAGIGGEVVKDGGESPAAATETQPVEEEAPAQEGGGEAPFEEGDGIDLEL